MSKWFEIWIDIYSQKIYKWPISTKKRCSASSVIRAMQIKATVGYHLLPSRTATIKRWTITTLGKDVRKLEPSCITEGYKIVHPLWKRVCQFLKKLNIELPVNPTILLLGISPRETNHMSYQNLCINVNSGIILNRQKVEINFYHQWIDKQIQNRTNKKYMCYGNTVEYYVAINRKGRTERCYFENMDLRERN